MAGAKVLTKVESGEDVTIARAGQPVARVVAVAEPGCRFFPAWPEYGIPGEILDAPLPEEELTLGQ